MEHKTTCKSNPSTEDAQSLIQDGIDFGNMVTLSGLCAADYEGRASSFFGYSDCFIVIKPDGTFLIHQKDGRKPTNWQPPGCDFESGVVNDELFIIGTRDSEKERVELRCPEVYSVQSYDIAEPEEKEMFGTEKQMQTRIMENPEILENGFTAVESEYPMDVGSIDIFGWDINEAPVIVELKRKRAGPKAADQLKRYVNSYEDKNGERPRGVLVAPSFTETTQEILSDEQLENLKLEPNLSDGKSFKTELGKAQ
jgi:RecB family endonuclease NucS